jgi:low affinity Fe/Cu permease
MEAVTMPREAAATDPNWFDRFADGAHKLVSKAWFFAVCVVMVAAWFPTLFLMPVDSSQLIINTSTTIITFLMVALLENVARRGDDATQHKLNAIAKFEHNLGQAMVWLIEQDDTGQAREMAQSLRSDIEQLTAAVGLENREST